MATAAPPKPPPPPSGPPQSRATSKEPSRKFSVSSGRAVDAQRFGIYGTGGIGKTKLASILKNVGVNPLIVDVENGSRFLNVDRVGDIQTWLELRSILQDESLISPYGAVVVDSLTKAEELAVAHTLNTVLTDGGERVDKIEGYGYGKGFTYAYEIFLTILGDLDAIVRRGKHVVVVCHDCKANVPNPYGEDWIRYEPRLQETPKGPTRSRVLEWCDHFFYVGYDVAVSKDGKGKGAGTRTIYATEMPTHKAKSRDLSEPIVYADGSPDLWNAVFHNKGE
jgi:hypothetical protein